MNPTPPLERIAAALERLAPPAPADTDWLASPAYVWDGEARPIARISAPNIALLRGIDAQKAAVAANIDRFAAGYAAHDMLLWGARGMGKSALVAAALVAAQNRQHASIALVQVAATQLATLPKLFAQLARTKRRFVVFIDDLGFDDADLTGPRVLRSWLEGGVDVRPGNVRLAVTSNRRAIVTRHLNDQDDPINPRDAVDDRLALADRFGLSIGFHACSQEDYLAIVAGYCEALALEWDVEAALVWTRQRGARSGRIAWQFVTELAGQQGKAI